MSCKNWGIWMTRWKRSVQPLFVICWWRNGIWQSACRARTSWWVGFEFHLSCWVGLLVKKLFLCMLFCIRFYTFDFKPIAPTMRVRLSKACTRLQFEFVTKCSPNWEHLDVNFKPFELWVTCPSFELCLHDMNCLCRYCSLVFSLFCWIWNEELVSFTVVNLISVWWCSDFWIWNGVCWMERAPT